MIATLHDGIAFHAVTVAGQPTYLLTTCGADPERATAEDHRSDVCYLMPQGPQCLMFYKRGRGALEEKGTVHPLKMATFSNFEAALQGALMCLSIRALR